jgi:mannose-6-phosphate isomerase
MLRFNLRHTDVMECMANSDNVIRAGLTPKLRDVPNLVANLTYNAVGPESHVVRPGAFRDSDTIVDGHPERGLVLPWYTSKYDPPIADFSVLRMNLSLDRGEHTQKAVDGPSICIVTEGSGLVRWGRVGDGVTWDHFRANWDKPFEDDERRMTLRKGDVFFVAAGWEVGFRKTGFHPLVVFRAFTPDSDP